MFLSGGKCAAADLVTRINVLANAGHWLSLMGGYIGLNWLVPCKDSFLKWRGTRDVEAGVNIGNFARHSTCKVA